jgi:hypothetical protein
VYSVGFQISKKIESRCYRAQWSAMAVATKRASDRLNVGTMLNREAENNRRIARVGVSLIAGFVIVQEQLTEPSVRETTESRRVPQPMQIEREILAHPPVRKSLACRRAHAIT